MSNAAETPVLPMRSARATALTGRVRVPGDKSISHRAMIFGLLAEGTTEVSGLLEGEDVLRSADAARALGATVTRHSEGRWSVEGVGLGRLHQPTMPLDFGNAGTGARLMMGVIGGHAITATFDGDDSLRKRPMRRILDPLVNMGVVVLSQAENGRLPVTLKGPDVLSAITYESPVASAQIKSAILLAGLNAAGETVVIEPEASRDHTEKLLAWFGADVRVSPHGTHGRRVVLQGKPQLKARPIVVPADPSSAAFPIVAALIVPGSDVIVEGVMMNPLRIGLILTLREMGADITQENSRDEGGETVADLRVRYSILTGVNVPAERAPSMIDEYPVLAVAAAFATGTTRMNGLQELRVKESDRLEAVAAGLVCAGVSHTIECDDLLVHGNGLAPRGGRDGSSDVVKTHMDHRIAMSFLVMGMASQQPMVVDDMAFIATSFPAFVALMNGLGGKLALL